MSCATAEKGTLATLGEVNIKLDIDVPIDSARSKAMANYSELMNASPTDSLRVEALRRMADLELERSEDRYQEQLTKLGEQRVLSQNQQAELKGVSYEKAIKLYEDALKASGKTGDIENADILYQLSKAYEQTGDSRKALGALDRLLDEFPNLENRDEVHFRRAELLFSLKEYKQAELAYTQAMLVSTSSPYYEKALSQRGWTAYKQNDYVKALYSFFSYIDRKMRDSTGRIGTDDSRLSRGEKELLSDSFRAVTLCFNELGGTTAINEHFKKYGARAYEGRVYKEFGDFYLEKGRYDDAAGVYAAFVKEYPNHPDAAQFELYRIQAYQSGGFKSKVVEAKLAFAQKYHPNSAYWNGQPKEVQDTLTPLAANNLDEIAAYYHARGQETKSGEDYQQAIFWYRQYLKSFPASEKAPKMNFLLAETLFENRQFEDATKEYEKAAYQYPDAGLNVEAGYAAILAYDEAAKQLTGRTKESWERLAVGSALRFGTLFPEDARSPKVVIKAAEDLFALQKFEQAAVAAKTILGLKVKTDSKMRRTAWLIVAQSELKKEQYAEAESAFRVALKLAEDDAKLRQTITDGLVAAVYERGAQLRGSGDLDGAIREFSRVGEMAPQSNVNINAQFDIAATLMAKEDWPAAIRKFQSFRSTYSSSPLQLKVTENLASIYLKTKRPVLAAQEFETLRNSRSDEEGKRQISWQIAQLYEEAGAKDSMIKAYGDYIQVYPVPLESAIEARQKLADVYKADGAMGEYYSWLKAIVKSDSKGGDARTQRTQYLAAQAAYELALPVLEQFQSVKLTAPLKTNLAKKKQTMESAVNAYTAAAQYGVEGITTASFFRLGEIYSRFGKDLLNSERPLGLSSDEREQYDILLEEQAFPFEEKSIDIHESNVRRVKDGTYDEWVKKSFAALRDLRPARYSKSERSETVAEVIVQ